MTTAVITLSPCDTAGQAVRLLVGQGVSSAPVVGEAGRVVGMVSEVDLLNACLLDDPGRVDVVDVGSAARSVLQDLRVRDVMTSRVLSLDPSDDVWDVARLLVEHGVKAAPVLAADRLVGLVARRDLLTAIGLTAIGLTAIEPTAIGPLVLGGPSTLVGRAPTGRG